MKLIQPPLDERDPFDDAEAKRKSKQKLIETGGLAFEDGECIELIRNRGGRLCLLHSKRNRAWQKIKRRRKTFIPPVIGDTLLEVLTLPSGRAACRSTTEIYTKIRVLFTERSASEKAAKMLAFWTLSSWFADTFAMTPSLAMTGSQPEAHLLIRVLGAVVRHGLPLAEINLSGLRSLPMHIQPTLLIGRLSPSTLRALSASNFAPAYVTAKEGLTNLCCSKAWVSDLRDQVPKGTLRLHIAPFSGKLPVVTDLALRELAERLQPLLVDFRMRHLAQVRDSNFDVPGLPSELRLIVRALGAPIMDAPELQRDLVQLLREESEDAGDTSNECIVLSALLSRSHSPQCGPRVYITAVAEAANRILKDSGSGEKVEAKAAGSIVRNSLGLRPKRNSRGFAIPMTEDVCRRIHQLAREFEVWTKDEMVSECSYCQEIAASSAQAEAPPD